MFTGWFKSLFAARKPVSAEDEVAKFIRDRFAAGASAVPVFDIRQYLWGKGWRLSIRLISLYAHDSGFRIKRCGPEGKYYILPRSK